LTTRWDEAGDRVRREIEILLDRSAGAWSAGDLDLFMECYENSPDTIYLCGSEDGTPARMVVGYSAIRSMYAERFGAGGVAMGILGIEVLRVSLLGAGHALVVGSYSLGGATSPRVDRNGLCSLVLHHTDRGWRISADHTS
jgi:ketosteroid isomerase-like protein